MKINPETRYQDLALYVKEHLDFISIDQVKFTVIGMAFGMYDLPLLLGLMYILEWEFLWMVSPFVVIVHVWAIRLAIKNPYSTQLEMILYMGIWGISLAVTLFIMMIWILYYTFYMSPILLCVMTILPILNIYFLVKYQINKFLNDPTIERKESNQYKHMWLAHASPGIGYLIYQIVMGRNVLDDIISFVVMYIFFIFGVYAAAKFLHRYFFMKANMKYVIYQPHGNKKKEKLIKQGVEIK